jgi:hypothetical protein
VSSRNSAYLSNSAFIHADGGISGNVGDRHFRTSAHPQFRTSAISQSQPVDVAVGFRYT